MLISKWSWNIFIYLDLFQSLDRLKWNKPCLNTQWKPLLWPELSFLKDLLVREELPTNSLILICRSDLTSRDYCFAYKSAADCNVIGPIFALKCLYKSAIMHFKISYITNVVRWGILSECLWVIAIYFIYEQVWSIFLSLGGLKWISPQLIIK